MGDQHMQLSSQMEDYLETIYQLCREEGVARVKGIAERLEVTNPSVVGAVKNLKRRKLVWQERYGYIRLTEEGQKIAGAINHRHEVLSCFFEKFLGLDPETASGDACRIEHAVSAETVQRLRSVAEFVDSEPQVNKEWLEKFTRFYSKTEGGHSK
jgi:DtxR family transcriptional regulator, Mn-dependent transcriptional regulator